MRHWYFKPQGWIVGICFDLAIVAACMRIGGC